VEGITATATSLADLWRPFLFVAIGGAAAVWYRPWMLIMVIVVALGVAWRTRQLLPDHDVVAYVADPATRAVFVSFWRHAYAAFGTAIIVPTFVAILRRKRPAA
jgi:hypothetical protein